MHGYLTDDDSGNVTSRNPIISVAEVLRSNRSGRDHAKVIFSLFSQYVTLRLKYRCFGRQQIFKFSDSDTKASAKVLKPYEDELNRALRTAVPGLMTETPFQSGQTMHHASLTTDDRYTIYTSTATSTARPTHKSLVVADAFNVSTLIGPTLAFLDRVKQIMPENMGLTQEDGVDKSFGGFLDDFVLRTFLPQLEDKVTSVFHQAVGGPSILQPIF